MKKLISTFILLLIIISSYTAKTKADDNAKPRLLDGPEFREKLKEIKGDPSIYTVRIVFTKDKAVTTDVDFSYNQDKSITGYKKDNDIYINCGENGCAINNCNSMFSNLIGNKNVATIDLNDSLDTSLVKDMSYMFAGSSNLVKIDGLDSLNTSNVETMVGMFKDCSYLESIKGMSSWNTSKVVDMHQMFYGCGNATEIDVSNFNTQNVNDMSDMFNKCSSLYALDLSNFNTSKVTNMTSMFENCILLDSIMFGDGFKTYNVKTADAMFYGCLALPHINLGTFNLFRANSVKDMFARCLSLKRIYTGYFGLVLNPNADTDNMFFECYSLVGQSGTDYNEKHINGDYARIDYRFSPGYFSRSDRLFDEPIRYSKKYNLFFSGDKLVDDIVYYNNVVYINNLVVNGDIKDTFLITLPEDTKEIRVIGENIINNNNYANTFPILNKLNSVKFTGKGSLNINNAGGSNALDIKNIKFSGPDITIRTNMLGTDDTAALVANNILMTDGQLNIKGTIGILLKQDDDNVPEFIVDCGNIDSYGTLSAFYEYLDGDVGVDVIANIKGSISLYGEVSDEVKLGLVSTENYKSIFAYVSDDTHEYTNLHVQFNGLHEPEPTPIPTPTPGKKDESCEKVIGPTWHWNNTKGICEEVGVVNTFTR